MTHTYNITGMTCNGCSSKVKSLLLKLPEVLSAEVSLNPGKAIIEMNSHLALPSLQYAISPDKKYVISEDISDVIHSMETVQEKTWIGTYKPLLLIFGYITFVSFIAAYNNPVINWTSWMNNFMAGFFLTFSFFKLLDLHGFANGYATYDLLAKKWRAYGFIYPFIELLFGVSLLIGGNLEWIYLVVVIVMGFSTLGVINSLRNKQIIECACLGTIFRVPLGTVTLIEDLLMVSMALLMLILI
ncbi:MAG: cation transporter [Chitinophagales bacterium]|nr:cation transporter [Chitinophagales bacterium]